MQKPAAAVVIAATLGLTALIGCNQSDPPAAGHSATPAAVAPVTAQPVAVTGASAADTPSHAQRLIQQVIERYRDAAAYRDDAVVRLAYLQSGKPQTDEAPLRVRYQASGRLRLTAYALDLACDAGRLEALIDAPAAGDLQHQLLRRPLSDGPLQLAELYADPAVLHFASAGLGGPSPQLELLLAPQPLAGLLSGEAELQWGSQTTIEGRMCQAIEIDAAGLHYVIWVDPQALLVRRIELPLQGVPSIAANAAIQSPRLTIEFRGAAFEADAGESYRVSATADDVPVHRFVPRPLPLPSELIGQQPPAFQLRSSDGAVTVTQRGVSAKAVVLLWVADHAGSKLAAGQLQSIAAALPAPVREATEFLIVMAEPANGQSTGQLLHQWQVQLPWTDDAQAIGRDVFGISTTPAACVLSADGRLQWFAHPAGPDLGAMLPNLLSDLASGIDIGGQARQQFDAAQQAYQQQLQQARWDAAR